MKIISNIGIQTMALVILAVLLFSNISFHGALKTPYIESKIYFSAPAEPPPGSEPGPTLPVEYYERIYFSGMWWDVKIAKNFRVGPQNNLFSNSSEDIWVDRYGMLHLTISKHGGEWYSTEVIGSSNARGYGTYIFHIESRLDDLDKNAVLGMFTYQNSSECNYREKDIEFAELGDNNVQYVVQPYAKKVWGFRQEGEASIHIILWHPDKIMFISLEQADKDFYTLRDIKAIWAYEGDLLHAPGDERVHMNLYLKANTAPANGKRIEVVISKFEFVPYRAN